MKTLIGILILSVFGAVSISPVPVYAVKTFKSEAVQKSDDNSYLFGSGTRDVTREFCLNDIVPVYRDVSHGWAIKGYGEVQTRDQVGNIKISSYVGNQNFSAQVMDGSVRPGDMAIKEGTGCTVAPAK